MQSEKSDPEDKQKGVTRSADGPTHALGASGGDARWLRSIVENGMEIVKAVALDGTLLYANAAFERILGYDPEYAVGNLKTPVYVSPRMEDLTGYRPEEFEEDHELWYAVVHPDDRWMVAAEDERTEKTGEAFAMEYRMVHRDGQVLWVRDQSVLVRSR